MNVARQVVGLAMLLTFSGTAAFAKDPPFKKGEQLFLAADEFEVAEEELFPPDRLTRGDTLKFIERKGDQALVGFAGDSQYKLMFGAKTNVGNGKPVARQTWVPLAKLARTHDEAIAPAGVPGEKPAKLSAEQWRSQLAGTWRAWGWEHYGRRHQFADPKPLRTKEGSLLPSPLGGYFWKFDETVRHFSINDELGPPQVYSEMWIDVNESPAIIDLIFAEETKHIYSHRYAVEMEGPRLRMAWLGASLGKDQNDLRKQVKKIPNPKRTWTHPNEIMLVDLLEREKEKSEGEVKPK